ncbi:hypothetical protein H0X48_05465 [Candidatus Dependentiae bacterium]|nr:hypothetical protein [Candidatus Dependentiae bacterium]
MKKSLSIFSLTLAFFALTQATKFDISLVATQPASAPLVIKQENVCFCHNKKWHATAQNITFNLEEILRTEEQEATFQGTITVKESTSPQTFLLKVSPKKNGSISFASDTYSFSVCIKPS